LPLLPHASYRRSILHEMYRKMEEEIENLTQRVEEQAGQRCRARLLMTHPGVGPVTALATEVFLGDARRFVDGKALASYGGAHSAGILQRGTAAARWSDQTRQPAVAFPEVRSRCSCGASRSGVEAFFCRRKLVQKGLGKARVAVARKLGIRLWIMLRDEIDYQEFCRRGQKQQSGAACAGKPEVANGAKSPADRE
jgi:transposase